MNAKDKKNLNTLIKEYDIDNNTDTIRDLKQSEKLRKDINELLNIKKTYKHLKDSKVFNEMIKKRCDFLFNNHKDIMDRILNESIDLNILYKLLDVLKLIEDGELDQHEGSYEVGKLLKSVYVDKVINKKRPRKIKKKPVKTLSWNEYKLISNEEKTNDFDNDDN